MSASLELNIHGEVLGIDLPHPYPAVDGMPLRFSEYREPYDERFAPEAIAMAVVYLRERLSSCSKEELVDALVDAILTSYGD